MANPSDDHPANLLSRQNLIVLGVLIAVLVGGYMLMVVKDDSRRDSQATVEDTRTESDDQPEVEHDDMDDQDRAARMARQAASRGEPSESVVEENDDEFVYIAGSGESLTNLARQAIAATNGDLSAVERVAAETKLVQDLGEALLDAGQRVTINKSDVESAIKWARNLSDEQKAAWQPYADMVVWE